MKPAKPEPISFRKARTALGMTHADEDLKLSWAGDGEVLECLFPGSSCAWDKNPHWDFYYLRVLSQREFPPGSCEPTILVAYQCTSDMILHRHPHEGYPRGFRYFSARAIYVESKECWVVIR